MDKSFINVKIIPLGNASASTLAKFAKELDDAFHYNNTVINVRYVQSPNIHIDIGINPKMIHEIHSLFDDPDALFYMDFYDDVIDCITVDTRLYHDEFVCDVESINTEKALFDIINKMRTRNKRVMFCASELDEYLNMFCKINEYPLMTGTFRILMHAFFKHVEYKQNEDSLSQVINEATVDLYNKQMKKAMEELKMKEESNKIQELGDFVNELKALVDKYDVPIITAQQKNCDKIDNDDNYIKNDDNYIKIDGEKANFDGGAIRNTKTGKGRFDLIPADVVATILDNAYVLFYSEGDTTVSLGDLLAETYKEFGTPSVEGYSSIVINIVNWVYTDKSLETKDDVGDVSKSVSYPQFIIAFSDMLKDLAKHYENGAEIYGIDNWKKGIPLTGGDRGGSFTDSMLRHLSQYISATKEMYYTEEPVTFEILYDDIERRFYRKGLDGKLQPEENHIIAAIWNAFGAIWTLLNDKK